MNFDRLLKSYESIARTAAEMLADPRSVPDEDLELLSSSLQMTLVRRAEALESEKTTQEQMELLSALRPIDMLLRSLAGPALRFLDLRVAPMLAPSSASMRLSSVDARSACRRGGDALDFALPAAA